MSCLAGKIFHSHNKILLSRDENNLLIDHSKFLKIFVTYICIVQVLYIY